MAREIWQRNYLAGRYNSWPYDTVVSLVLRYYGAASSRGEVRILDLGCGGGNNSLFLAQEGFDFRAVDASPEAVRLTKERLGLDEGDGRVVTGDFTALPFDDGMFDAVIDRASLCCNLTDDLRRSISEIRRVLAPGGRFFGVDLYGEGTTDLGEGQALGNGDYHGFTAGLFAHSEEVHAFTAEQIHQLFDGFRIESLERVTVENALDDGVAGRREHFNLVARAAES